MQIHLGSLSIVGATPSSSSLQVPSFLVTSRRRFLQNFSSLNRLRFGIVIAVHHHNLETVHALNTIDSEVGQLEACREYVFSGLTIPGGNWGYWWRSNSSVKLCCWVQCLWSLPRLHRQRLSAQKPYRVISLSSWIESLFTSQLSN